MPVVTTIEDSAITVTRARMWNSKFWSWEIVLDGAVVGRLRDGQRVTIAVPPGRHVLAVRNGSRRVSNRLEMSIGPNAGIEFVTRGKQPFGGGGPGWRATPVLTGVRIGPGSQLH
jgi:hypothetical protein